MPWHVEETEGDTPFCVVADDSGETVQCYAERADALERIAELYAEEAEEAAAADLAPAVGRGIHALLVVERWATEDRRYFDELQIREQPLWSFMIQDRANHGGVGDTSSWFAGAFTTIERDPREATRILVHGNLLAGPRGDEAEALILGGLRAISMDGVGGEYYLDVREVDLTGWPTDWLERWTGTSIVGGTATPFAAVGPCVIWLDGEDEPPHVATTRGEDIPITPTEDVQVRDDGTNFDALLASGGGPQQPPAAWFENPNFGRNPEVDPRLGEAIGGGYGCHLTVTDAGQLYGHLACWRTPHMTFAGRTIFAPRSASQRPYEWYMRGETPVEGGERLRTGVLTMGTGHASDHRSVGAQQAMAHYDNTGTVVADIRVGEDDHGIWVAGAVRPHVTDDQIRALIACDVSGDWRDVNGLPELVAVLCVNTPGFPVPRAAARVAEGRLLSLVAAAGPAWVPRDGRPALRRKDEHEPRYVVISAERLDQMIDERLRAAGVTPGSGENGDDGSSSSTRRNVSAPPLKPTAHAQQVQTLVASGLSPRAAELVAAAEAQT